MAAGDPYFTCDNTFLSIEQALRKMVVIDGNGKPVFDGINVTPPAIQEYYLRHVSDDNIFPPMDGVEVFRMLGKLIIAFGWCPLTTGYPLVPLPFIPNSKYLFESLDDGLTWTQIADSPAPPTHGQGHGVRLDGKFWHWGIEDEGAGTSSFVWNMDTSGTWTQISPDWTLGNRVSHRSFLHKDYLYTFGGQSDFGASPTPFGDMYRSADGLTWTLMSSLPVPFMSASTSWTDSDGNLYITGGGQLRNNPDQHLGLVDKIYISANDGVTWSVFALLPTNMQAIWPDAFVFDGKVFYLNGYKTGSNQPGIFISDNWGLSWTLFSNKMPARHLTGGVPSTGFLDLICGNLWNDHWRIEKITYPFAMDPDVQDWYERLYPADRPSLPVLTARNNFVLKCKAHISLDGVTSNWDCLDWFHLFAGCENEAQSLQPMKTSNGAFKNGLTKIGNPTLDFNGVTGNGVPGSATGLNTNWNSALHAVKFQTNSASLFLYSLSTTIEDSNDFGCPRLFLSACQTNNLFYGAVNDTFEASTPAVNGKGYRGASRFNSMDRELVLNTSHVASTQISDPIAGYVCIGGSGPGLNNPSSKTYAADGIGNGFLDHDHMKLITEEYLTEIGIAF